MALFPWLVANAKNPVVVMKQLILAGALVIASSTPALAQNVDAPVVAPGDRWVYQSGAGKQSLTVAEVKADGTIVANIDTPSLGGLEIRFTKEWNPLVQPQAMAGQTVFLHYDPPVCVMPPAPWHVGQEWSCQSKYDFNNNAGTVAVNGKIETVEKVTVPAGSFDALRVNENVGGVATTVWYAPAVRQFVKIDAGANSPYSMELTSFLLK